MNKTKKEEMKNKFLRIVEIAGHCNDDVLHEHDSMRAKDIKCKKCGGSPCMSEEDGPWFVYCGKCGEETLPWGYQREAWANWAEYNRLAFTRHKLTRKKRWINERKKNMGNLENAGTSINAEIEASYLNIEHDIEQARNVCSPESALINLNKIQERVEDIKKMVGVLETLRDLSL